MSLMTFLGETILFPNVQKDEMKLRNVPCPVLWDRRRKHFHPQREKASGQLPGFVSVIVIKCLTKSSLGEFGLTVPCCPPLLGTQGGRA